MTKKLITADTLREWTACLDGFKRFCELFPEGADLKTASDGLIADGHHNWSNWLWSNCARSEDFRDQTVFTGGADSTLTAGNGSKLTAGNGSTLKGGNGSTLTAGAGSTLTAGADSTLTAGYGSLFFLKHRTAKHYRAVCATVGEDGIKADTPYTLDKDGKFVEVVKGKTQ